MPADFWSLTLAEWQQMLEGWKLRRDMDAARTGLLCAVMANCHRDPKKRPRPFTPKDFMPRQGAQKQTPEQMLAAVKAWNGMMGGAES